MKHTCIAMVLAGAFGAPLVGAQAQTAPGTPGETQPTRIERVEVTGSNIKRTDTETAAPIQVITAEEIRRSGKQSITEVLRTLPSNATGGLNDLTGANSFSSGASTVSLRGLGSAATLVLLNGRRVAPYGLADPNFGQSAAVNLDSIPLDVVERIEVLKDGASAIYGSEAIAGVVNIILRRDFKGALLGATGSTNTKGLYNTANVNATFGVGDIAADRYNLFGNIDVYSRERVSFRDAEDFLNRPQFFNSTRYRTGQRAFSSYAPQLNLFPGFVYNPATLGESFIFTNAGAASANPCPPGLQRPGEQLCRYDIWEFQEIVPKSDRASVFTRGTIELGSAFQAFAELGFNQIKTKYVSPPQVAGDFGSWFASGPGRIVNIPEVLPPNNPSNPTGDFVAYRYRFSDVGPTGVDVKSDTVRALLGVKGSLAGWDLESALLYNENRTDAIATNQIRTSVFTQAVLNGTYNFLNPSAGSVTAAQLRVNSKDEAKSSFAIFDVKGSRELFALPGGTAAIALGAEFRREERTATPDPLKVQGEIIGYGAASAQGSRNVTSLYTELNLPVLKGLEAQVAVRSDRYSDYGSSTTPKLAATWAPNTKWKFRGSYAEGFRAPSLTEISKSSVSAFTTVEDPKLCIDGSQNECFQPIGLLIEANPNVQPEKAKTYNLGAVFEASRDVSMSLDYFWITRRNEINILDLNEILRNEDNPDPRYAGRVVRGQPAPGQTVGPIQVIRSGFFNFGRTKLRGVDLDVRVRNSLGDMGRLSSSLLLTFYDQYRIAGTASSPFVSQLGYRDYPRTRATLSTSWDYGAWTHRAAVNHLSRFKPYSAGDATAAATCSNAAPSSVYLGICEVSDFTTLDLGTEYRGIKNLTLSLSVRNATNKKPPADPLVRPANLEWHSPQGAYFTFGARYAFN
jgi:iron complex outermembrane receptor protein